MIPWHLWNLDADHNPVAVSFDEIGDFVAALMAGHEEFEERFRVGWTRIDGDCYVSTVFLFAQPSFDGDGPPLFETMVFGGDGDKMQRRYATWDEALAGHQEVVDLVMARA